jgi:hypothetical protein
VWKELVDLLSQIRSGLDIQTKPAFEKLLAFLGENSSRWPSPSTVRNNWNYALPELFGSLGEAYSKEFRKQNGKVESTLKWANTMSLHRSNTNEVLGVNYCVNMLKIIYDGFHTRVLSESTLAELHKKHALVS